MDRLYRLSQEERGAIRKQIAAELSREPDVLFAYVYGSFCQSEVFHHVEIGVYLSNSHFNNTMAANLSAHLSGILTLPVDIRPLNMAPISFRLYVLRGECLFSRDDTLCADILEDTRQRYLNIASQRGHTPKKTFNDSESDDS